jgi:type I restriction enzyme S subunit
MVAKSASPAAIQILEEIGLADLPEDWEIVRVEDLLLGDRGISVGVMYPGDHDPAGIPLIRAGDLAGSRINPRPEFRITRNKHFEYRRTELTGGELLISLVGNVGRCALVPA